MATPVDRAEALPVLRASLAERLGLADDATFLGLIWALNALQTGRAEAGARYLSGFPADAAMDGVIGQNAIYPWELETLANELLAGAKNSRYRAFDCRSWNSAIALVNLLRSLENAEYGARRDTVDIHVELGRIGARQFPWQRGYFGMAPLYRSAVIYGQGACADYLTDAAKLSVGDLILVGFALRAVLEAEPTIRPASGMALLHELGLDRATLDRVLARIACPLAVARVEAAALRAGNEATAYKPSILRRFPCLLVGHRSRTMIAPLPDLVMDRVTNGLFYDVVGGGGPVREDIGGRFEGYALDLLTRMLPAARFSPELRYRTPLGPVETTDIMMLDRTGAVTLTIECKAPRMSLAARFGEAPEGDRGYEEIAKGVMQSWRFAAHARRQLAPVARAPGAQALVLTLDEWFAGRSTVIPAIMARAHALADASPHGIDPEDRGPIAFCTISELEDVLRTATAASLREALVLASGERVGWMFSILHQETVAAKAPDRPYPFDDALGDVLPWYARLGDLTAEQRLPHCR